MFKRLDDENERQFLWRLGQAKDNGLVDFSWEEIADIMNKEFREDVSEYRSEAAYRKPYQQAKQFYEAGTFSKFSEDTYIAELREAKHEVRKEKQKLWDERTALNKVLREEGRRESMFDIVKYAIEKYQPIKFDYEPHTVDSSDNDLIIHLTDIHCGVNIDSPFNKFNTNILKDRLQRFLNEILDIQRMYQSENAYLILGGDNIVGLIHLNARIEAKENVITQIMTVTDLISDFIYELSKIFSKVEVHSTAGNHSRSTASKDETTKGENFDLLVPYICKKDLRVLQSYVPHEASVAAAMAMAHGADLGKAELAGLLHDCAKNIPDKEQLRLCTKHKIPINEIEKKSPYLLHAKLGAWIARKKYEVDDEEVLDAIRWHTTGTEGMSKLAQIVFIADYIEPGRCKAKNLAEVRPLAFSDLDECCYVILRDTLKYLEIKGNPIDPETENAFYFYKLIHDTKEKE